MNVQPCFTATRSASFLKLYLLCWLIGQIDKKTYSQIWKIFLLESLDLHFQYAESRQKWPVGQIATRRAKLLKLFAHCLDSQIHIPDQTSSKPSKMRYLKAAKFQHIKLKNLSTDLLPYGKRNGEKVKIWSYLNRFLAGCLDELMMNL